MPAKVFQRETIETGHASADARPGWSESDRSAKIVRPVRPALGRAKKETITGVQVGMS
jgi:hypothetical protein